MSSSPEGDFAGKLTRRRLLAGAAVAAGGAATGIAIDRALQTVQSPAPVTLGPQPAGLPARQHAWDATLKRDEYGNAIAPRSARLLFFDVVGSPTGAHARVLEAALRTLERRFAWGPSGLLFAVGWGPSYFRRGLSMASPIPTAKGLSDFELPSIDNYDVCVHLACDDERRLAEVQAALERGARLSGADGPLDVSSALRARESRTGFVGEGLPAAHQHVNGIPSGNPVSAKAPLFMGFKSGLRHNQAGEDDVTIANEAFAGGTTMQVSYMQLRLESWYEQLDERERVARMYAPQVTPAQAAHFTTDAASDPDRIAQAITRYGVIGHSQATARARRNDKPLILRRDFNTVDGGEAGLHFVSIQRTIEDFIATRTAMNAAHAQLQNPSITDTVNNGVNEFIFVLKRGNYIVPSREMRSFPLLPGRDRALV